VNGRAAAGLLLAVAILASGCDGERQVFLSPSRPVVNRDTTSMAVGIEYSHYRQMNVFDVIYRSNLLVESGFEIQTYDLAHRHGPRRIARWRIRETEHPWLIEWDDSGIVVDRGLPDAQYPVRVDPVTGVARPFASVPVQGTKAWAKDPNRSESWSEAKHRTHVFRTDEGFLLWNPRSRHEEFLFSLPTEHEGYPNLNRTGSDVVAARRYAATIHGVWNATTLREADSTRFRIETFVPRPGSESRIYSLRLSFERPDTSKTSEEFFATDRKVPMVQRNFRLGPTATTLELAVSNRHLQELINPFRRTEELRRLKHWGHPYSASVLIDLRLARPPEATSGIPAYDSCPFPVYEEASVEIPVP
jgi:hypothetical protein